MLSLTEGELSSALLSALIPRFCAIIIEQYDLCAHTPCAENLAVVGVAEIQTSDERTLAKAENRLGYGIRWSRVDRRIAVSEASLTTTAAARREVDGGTKDPPIPNHPLNPLSY